MRAADEVADETGHGVLAAVGVAEVHQRRALDHAFLAGRVVAPALADVPAAVPEPATSHDLAVLFDDEIVVPDVDLRPERGLGTPEGVVEALPEKLLAVGPEEVLSAVGAVDQGDAAANVGAARLADAGRMALERARG